MRRFAKVAGRIGRGAEASPACLYLDVESTFSVSLMPLRAIIEVFGTLNGTGALEEEETDLGVSFLPAEPVADGGFDILRASIVVSSFKAVLCRLSSIKYRFLTSFLQK